MSNYEVFLNTLENSPLRVKRNMRMRKKPDQVRLCRKQRWKSGNRSGTTAGGLFVDSEKNHSLLFSLALRLFFVRDFTVSLERQAEEDRGKYGKV